MAIMVPVYFFESVDLIDYKYKSDLLSNLAGGRGLESLLAESESEFSNY